MRPKHLSVIDNVKLIVRGTWSQKDVCRNWCQQRPWTEWEVTKRHRCWLLGKTHVKVAFCSRHLKICKRRVLFKRFKGNGTAEAWCVNIDKGRARHLVCWLPLWPPGNPLGRFCRPLQKSVWHQRIGVWTVGLHQLILKERDRQLEVIDLPSRWPDSEHWPLHSRHLGSTYVLGAGLTHFISITVPYPHLTDEAAEVQRSEVTCPGSHSWKVVEFLPLIRLLKQKTSPRRYVSTSCNIITCQLSTECLTVNPKETGSSPGLEEIGGYEWWMGLDRFFGGSSW